MLYLSLSPVRDIEAMESVSKLFRVMGSGSFLNVELGWYVLFGLLETTDVSGIVANIGFFKLESPPIPKLGLTRPVWLLVS